MDLSVKQRTIAFVVDGNLNQRVCDLEECGNWLGGGGNRPGQRQDLWKYLDASFPHRKFKQVLRPESQVRQALARCFSDQYFLSILVYREDPEWALSRYAFESIKEGLEMVYIVSGACALKP